MGLRSVDNDYQERAEAKHGERNRSRIGLWIRMLNRREGKRADASIVGMVYLNPIDLRHMILESMLGFIAGLCDGSPPHHGTARIENLCGFVQGTLLKCFIAGNYCTKVMHLHATSHAS